MRKVTKPNIDNIPNTTGGRVEYVRTRAGEKQDDLAKDLNISRNYLSMIESNVRIPNIDMLINLIL